MTSQKEADYAKLSSGEVRALRLLPLFCQLHPLFDLQQFVLKSCTLVYSMFNQSTPLPHNEINSCQLYTGVRSLGGKKNSQTLNITKTCSGHWHRP